MNFDPTGMAQLSAIINQKMHNFTFGDILSALQSLQSLPIHPYEQLKYRLFEKDHQFKTINDIPVPEDFNYQTCGQELSCIFNNVQSIGLSALSAVDQKIASGEILDKANLKHSVTDASMVDEDLVRKNVEFNEVVSSMSLNDIDTKPIETAQKLITHYINIFKQ